LKIAPLRRTRTGSRPERIGTATINVAAMNLVSRIKRFWFRAITFQKIRAIPGGLLLHADFFLKRIFEYWQPANRAAH